MKTKKFLLRICCFLTAAVLMSGAFTLSANAAGESDYVAEFVIRTDKQSVKKDEDVTVSVNLKTNYYICSMSLPVIYDSDAFTLQNTSDAVSSFLTFTGKMAENYFTNGTWKSPEAFYKKRNSNTEYWSQAEVMAKYKIAFASWSADTSISSEMVMLEEEETVVKFVLKANRDIEDFSGTIFISSDFQKTSSSQQGILFAGRCTQKEFSLNNMVSIGQTISFLGLNPSEEDEPALLPADGTHTVIDKENGLIYGLSEGAESLDGFVKVEGYTLKYTYFSDSFGTGTKVECVYGGKTVETYYVVIFGDINGDGNIDVFDLSALAAEVNGDIEIDWIQSIAADVFPDESVDTFDYALLVSTVNGETEISQIK